MVHQYIKRHNGLELICGNVAPAYLQGQQIAIITDPADLRLERQSFLMYACALPKIEAYLSMINLNAICYATRNHCSISRIYSIIYEKYCTGFLLITLRQFRPEYLCIRFCMSLNPKQKKSLIKVQQQAILVLK